MQILARYVALDLRTNIAEVRVGSHHLVEGGPADGFCYEHCSFDCALTPDEQVALAAAELPEPQASAS